MFAAEISRFPKLRYQRQLLRGRLPAPQGLDTLLQPREVAGKWVYRGPRTDADGCRELSWLERAFQSVNALVGKQGSFQY